MHIMKRLSLIFGFLTILFLTSCGNSDESSCNCTTQRYERSVTRTTDFSNTLLSATPWVPVGAPTPYGTDCSANGLTPSYGSFNAYSISATTYGVQEYENRVTCR